MRRSKASPKAKAQPLTNHPERKPTRLTNYDYSLAGAYFVTINAYHRELLFGDVVDGIMRPNALGDIVRDVWMRTPTIRPYIELDEFVVMPNHFHAILFIHENHQPGVRATSGSPLPKDGNPRGPAPDSLGAIIAGFKSAATKRINAHRNHPGLPVWQRNYHDRIIRNDRQLHATRQYIQNNPQNWHDDENHPDKP